MDDAPVLPGESDGRAQHLVLVGSGGTHARLLSSLAARRLPHDAPQLRITLIAPDACYWHAPSLPDWVMGKEGMARLAFPLEPQLKALAARHLAVRIRSLDADNSQLLMANGETIRFDALSVEIGADCDPEVIEASLPGSLEHGLWVQPMRRFTALWPQLAELTRAQPTRIAVIGDGQLATSLALAMQQVVAHDPQARPCRVSLVSGINLPLAHSPPSLQGRVLDILRKRNITVLQDRCTALSGGDIQLANGARLACDAAVVALLAPFPAWVARSRLGHNPQGLIDVDDQGQSASHARVFFTRYLPVDTSGAAAFQLESNLCGILGQPLPIQTASAQDRPGAHTESLPIGMGRAIVRWSSLNLQGSLVWHALRWQRGRALHRAGMRA